MQITLSQIAQFSAARVIVEPENSERVITHLTWDSRTVIPGSLFVALAGENTDGNEHITDALSKGAAAVLASRETSEAQLQKARETGALLLEVDAGTGLEALQALASGYRALLNATVIGITGSSGKTTTKDLVAGVLSSGFITHATQGNYNNEIGAPATVLETDPSVKALVVEMGMETLGEIALLCRIARPNIGIITNVGVAHCERLGSRENIARAKAELIESLPNATGIAILNGDDPFTPFIREIAQTNERGIRVLLYGLGSHNDIRAAHIEYDQQGHPSFDLWLPDGIARRTKVALQGEHNVYNALAAATCGHVCGIAPESITKSLANARPAAMRQETVELTAGATVINDTYNANPDSMRAALALLSRFDHERLHIAVLGDMYELGAEEERFHREVGAYAHISRADMLVTVGERAQFIAQGALDVGMQAERVIACADVDTALTALKPYLSQRPVILVKASRGMRLEQLVDGMIKHDDGAAQTEHAEVTGQT
ncbi:MAG: UDP-N-acetylmuramoyl-tripeptide--D-alanyl-D-alanine ligase [Coriobacteriia bacterium]|nr:UDP-N-acetylmuramoyl-tripeptide--D-alanyl-D-alanine ligase [Coriobacteriia bacterium]